MRGQIRKILKEARGNKDIPFPDQLLSDDYVPPEIITNTKHYLEAYYNMLQALEDGMIMNATYNEIKRYLGNAIYSSFNWKEKANPYGVEWRPLTDNEDLYYGHPSTVHAILSYKKKVDATSGRWLDMPEFQELKQKVEQWYPIGLALQWLKDKTVKQSELTKEKKKREQERYRASFDMAKAKGVADILNDIVKQNYEDTLKNTTERTIANAEYYIDKQDGRSYWKFLQGGYAKFIFQRTARELPVQEYGGTGHKYVLKDNYKDICASLAKESTDNMKDAFIAKNVTKLTSLIEDKEIESYEILDIDIDFMATIRLEFADGTGFQVRNKTVMKFSSKGNPFYQFPTTFHNVTFPDGTIKSMVSERQMNEKWKSA